MNYIGIATNELYRVENARKTNSKKFPTGYIYILSIPELDLYKIGVSNNPKRRIGDIKSVLPFQSRTIYLQKYKQAYKVEKEIHSLLSEKAHRKEWFKLNEYDLQFIKSKLESIYLKENQLRLMETELYQLVNKDEGQPQRAAMNFIIDQAQKVNMPEAEFLELIKDSAHQLLEDYKEEFA